MGKPPLRPIKLRRNLLKWRPLCGRPPLSIKDKITPVCNIIVTRPWCPFRKSESLLHEGVLNVACCKHLFLSYIMCHSKSMSFLEFLSILDKSYREISIQSNPDQREVFHFHDLWQVPVRKIMWILFMISFPNFEYHKYIYSCICMGYWHVCIVDFLSPRFLHLYLLTLKSQLCMLMNICSHHQTKSWI